ncbi:SIR2 family protein [Brenneria goodwinii]|uniref:SIR2 family protein n=1 Tax=Brenneria goodwinii TaxID=1109412 RepID=UPI0036ECBB72
MQRAYYGHEQDREYFERVFQSANINFLIGSGASLPAIRVLGDIEAQLEEHVRSGNDLAYFQHAGDFLSSVWQATDTLLARALPDKPHSQPTVDNVVITRAYYSTFLHALEMILIRRRTGLLPRRVNLFTTNYDLFIEDAAVRNFNIILNDGFSRRGNLYGVSLFDPASFYHTTHATGNLYNYSVELPTINLIKLHGSLSWLKYENDLYYQIPPIKPEFFSTHHALSNWVLSHTLILPRKDKFRETLLENIYYDLLRSYSNELDKEGSLLVVFGFSFADEHIETLTKKALRNTTLKIIIFAYDETARLAFLDMFRDYSNVEVVYTPGKELGFNKMNEIINCFLRR